MKRMILFTALLSACILASCGDADASSNTAPDVTGAATTTTPSSIAESSAAEESSPESEADASEQESTEQPETSGDENSTEDDPYTKLLASVDRDHLFVDENDSDESVTFGELLDMGRANVTAEGCGYCLLLDSGAAGSLYYKVMYTEDGGESFKDGGFVSIYNGGLQFFRIEDGRLLVFDKASAIDGDTAAIVMTFENNEVKTEINQQYFYGLDLNDGTALAPHSYVLVKGTYLGDYKMHLTVIEDGSSNVLLDTDAELDSASLGLVMSDAAE